MSAPLLHSLMLIMQGPSPGLLSSLFQFVMGNRAWYQASLYETQFKHRITSNTLKIWQSVKTESSNLINSQSSNSHSYKPEVISALRKAAAAEQGKNIQEIEGACCHLGK